MLSSATLAAESIGEWSQSVEGIRGRLIAREDKPYIGTRFIAIYIELENTANVADPIYIFFDPVRAIDNRVIDAAGNTVKQPPNVASIMSPAAHWLAVPWDGRLLFHASVSGYGVYKNSGVAIPMMSGNWLIAPGDKRKYYLEATLRSTPPDKDPAHRFAWHGPLKLPRLLLPTAQPAR
jgi:hypothetical protein